MQDRRERLLLMGFHASDAPGNYHGTPRHTLNGRNYDVAIELTSRDRMNIMVSVQAPVTIMLNPVAIKTNSDTLDQLARLMNTSRHDVFMALLALLTGE